jgi:cyclase
MTLQMRILRPAPHVWAFYDGRIEGYRFAPGANWVDDGALSLGIASYAVVDRAEALIYDTHCSVPHARFIRQTLEAAGVRHFTVVLSHWHLDHVAGTEVFADCPIIANSHTARHLQTHCAAIEGGTSSGAPAIAPLILPTQSFDGQAHIHIGRLHIDLIQCNIHSDDATVVWLGHDGILLAGDTVEDTVTYVSEPEHLAAHIVDLDRLTALAPRVILPNHGAPDQIAAGSYGPATIKATQDYIWQLLAARSDATLQTKPLQEWIAPALASGALTWFDPYRDIHAQNLARTLASLAAN